MDGLVLAWIVAVNGAVKIGVQQAEETLHILSHQYEEEAHIYLCENFDDLKVIEELLRAIRLKVPAALIALSESPGKKRGDNESHAKKTLINGLIATYEKFTGKKALDNFQQPKAHGRNYRGQFYEFIYEIFKAIDGISKSRDIENMFSIDLSEKSVALGELIKKTFKKTKQDTSSLVSV